MPPNCIGYAASTGCDLFKVGPIRLAHTKTKGKPQETSGHPLRADLIRSRLVTTSKPNKNTNINKLKVKLSLCFS